MPLTVDRPQPWTPIMAACPRCQRHTLETRGWTTPEGARGAAADLRCATCRHTATVRAAA